MSKFPTKALPMHGPSDIFQSSRAVVTSTLLDNAWLTGGVVYGEPDGHLYPRFRSNNEALLQTVVGQVGCLAVGPRVIAGDWNVEFGSLPSFEVIHRLGFIDLQDFAWTRWGIPLQNACKQVTRKVFLSHFT